jgi:tetratricopeptide (TPR) repeat protein
MSRRRRSDAARRPPLPAASISSAIDAPFTRREWVLLAGLTLAGFVWRVGVWLEIRRSSYADLLTVDGLWHYERALRIAAGTYREDVFFRAPLYYYLLGWWYAVVGASVKAAQAAQVVMSALTLPGIYLTTRRLFGPAAAAAALSLAAFYAMFAYFAVGELVTVTLTLFLNAFGLWLLLVAADRRRLREWLLAGLIFGLSAITRPDVLVFVLLVPLWILRGKHGPRAVAAFALGCVIPLLPVAAHNYFGGGDRVLVASQSGINFFIGNNPEADGVSAVVPEIEARHGDFDEHVAIARQALGDPHAQPSAISAYWSRRGRDYILGDFTGWLGLEARKLYLYWNAHEIGNNRVIRFVTDHSVLATYFSLRFWALAPLAAAGLWIAVSGRRPVALLALYVVAYCGATILYFVNARFRMPIVPALLPLAGYAVVCGFEALRARQWKSVAAPATVAIVTALVIWPYAPLARGEINGHFQDALMFAKAGDRDGALRELLKARELKPESVATHLALGRLYLEKFGDLGHSVRSFEEAIRLAPEDPVPVHDLGVAYLGAARYADAERQFIRALAIAPDYAKALDNLGYTYEKEGRPDDARRAYDKLVEIAPDFPGARAAALRLRGR